MKFDRVNEQTSYSEKEIDHLACAYVIALGYEGAIMLLEGLLSGSEQSTVEPDDALAILCRRVLDAINDEAATITRILDRMLPALLAGENDALADEFACRPNLIDRHIGGRVQQRRVQLGWSTAELAERLAVTTAFVAAMERGSQQIDAVMLDRAVIDRRVLVALDRLSVFAVEFQELDVNLDLMAGHLLLVALGVDLADARPARQSAQTMPLENAVDASIGELDGVIARQVPDDAHRPEMIGLPQMQDLFNDLGGCAIGWVLRDGLAVLQTRYATLSVGISPAVEAGATHTEIPAGPPDIADRLSVLENPKFMLRLASEPVHRHHPFRPTGLQ